MFTHLRAIVCAIFYFSYFLIRYNLFKKYNVTITSAVDESTHYGIGFELTIPWKISEDVKYFKNLTYKPMDLFNKILNVKNIVICGGNTFESLKRTNLPGRHMIVVSRDPLKFLNDVKNKNDYRFKDNIVFTKNLLNEYIIYVKNVDDVYNALRFLTITEKGYGKIFIMGGSQIYNTFLDTKIKGINVKECIISFVGYATDYFIPIFNRRYDTFFPFDKIKSKFKLYSSRKDDSGVSVSRYVRK